MSQDDNKYKISRRKTLAALGTIGAASAGAGLGTSAWFSDRETFENNTITAGELDLKVDWEEHYYDSGAESVVPASEMDEADFFLPALEPRRMSNGMSNHLASRTQVLPIALDFTEGSDMDSFWEETAIEAFPDVEIEEPVSEDYDGRQVEEIQGDICDYPADLDGVLSHPFRTGGALDDGVTIGEGPNPQTTKPGDSLVSIGDVKPGDFGEVTLSFHLCDNDGYVWLTGELQENLENNLTEPEENDPEEDGTDEGELLDKILTRMWYDEDCDNQLDELEGPLDMVLAVDVSGSIQPDEQEDMITGINEFIDQLPSGGDVQVGSLTFGKDRIYDLKGLGDPADLTVNPGSGDFGGNTPTPPVIDIADQFVRDTGAGAREDAEKAIVLFTDGGPNYFNAQYGVRTYPAPRDNTTDYSWVAGDDTYDNSDGSGGNVTLGEMQETGLVADTVRNAGTRIATVYVGDDDTEAMTQDALDEYGTLPNFLAAEVASPGFAFTTEFEDLEDLATDLVESVVVGEEILFIGTLGQALERLEQENGIPLDGDLDTPFDEIFDPADSPTREPFTGGETSCIAMEWWLPINHGNEVQGDSVGFDLGFYTEQARHNDGAGLVQNESTGNVSNGDTPQ